MQFFTSPLDLSVLIQGINWIFLKKNMGIKPEDATPVGAKPMDAKLMGALLQGRRKVLNIVVIKY